LFSFPDEGKKLHFVSPARRKSVLAPILSKIKNGADAGDGCGVGLGEKKNGTDGSGHIAVQIEPAKKVKVNTTFSIFNLQFVFHSEITNNLLIINDY